jgi:REP element-mobilizing transposase RayT
LGQSLVSNNIHIVFSTKGRLPLLDTELQPRLWRYLAGIVKNIGGIPYAINGQHDHVHMLIAMNAVTSIAKVAGTVKANSSRWIGEHKDGFAWQRGYAAFTVSTSNLRSVMSYIDNQEHHHRRRDFKHELIALLERHSVSYDPRYIFD